jgi:hypothetical protein
MVAACTPEPPPVVTPTPSPPTSSSPAASPTPTESAIERRMRLDYEAAERAYRANMAEQDRQSQLGIAKRTKILEITSTGAYLEVALLALEDIKDSGWRAQGTSNIVGVAQGGWQERRLHLIACEDGSAIRFIDKSGRDVTPKNLRRKYVQRLTVINTAKRWKLSDLESKSVKSFQGTPCAL